MLLMLMIFTEVTAEWVEISQQHYRKPLRTHNIHNPSAIIEAEDTLEHWDYNNKSLTDYNWNKITAKQPNIANLKRVQLSGNAETSIENGKRPHIDEDVFDLDLNYGSTMAYSASGNQKSSSGKQKGLINKVSNRGNVKRVQLNNSVIKSPALNAESDKDKIHNDRYEELPLDNEQDEVNEFKETVETKFNNRRIYLNAASNQHSWEPTSIIPTNRDAFIEAIHDIKKHPKSHYKNQSDMNKASETPFFITETDEFVYSAEQKHNYERPNLQKKVLSTTKATTSLDNETVTKNNSKNLEQTTLQSHKNYELTNIHDKTKGIAKQAMNKMSQIELDDKYKNDNTVSHQEQHLKKDDQYESKNQEEIKKKSKPDDKSNNMDHLMKLLKVVANTISENSRRSLGGKLRYLHELKDSILVNIAERIDSTWPDDDTTGPHRSSRSTPRGHHVQFPSSESALMTISFLTFAVFLIKLVLQLISTYKNKAMMVAPVMLASATRAAHSHRRHL